MMMMSSGVVGGVGVSGDVEHVPLVAEDLCRDGANNTTSGAAGQGRKDVVGGRYYMPVGNLQAADGTRREEMKPIR